jgi:DNA-binding SARP family transcriptional activator
MAAELRIWLLGEFRVEVDSRPVPDGSWRRNKAKAVVKLLALAPRHRLHREQLMDLLWPELAADAAAANLRKAVHFARQSLAPEHLALRDELLRLQAPRLWVDVDAFEAAADARDLTAAIELYAGDLLLEDRFEPWTEERRERLRSRFARLLQERAVELEAAGDLRGAAVVGERLAAADPLNEQAVVALMRVYALAGQRHLALGWFRQLETRLAGELGVAPGTEARRLREEVAAGRFPPAPEPAAPAATPPPAAAPEERKLVTAMLLDAVPRRRRRTRSARGWSWSAGPGWSTSCCGPGAAPPNVWSAARSWRCSASPGCARTTRRERCAPRWRSSNGRRCRSASAWAPAR